MEMKLTEIMETKVEVVFRKARDTISGSKVEFAEEDINEDNVSCPVQLSEFTAHMNSANISITNNFCFEENLECSEKPKSGNLHPTNEKNNSFLQTLGVEVKIVELQRLGKFFKDRSKRGTVLVTVSHKLEARLLIANGVKNEMS